MFKSFKYNCLAVRHSSSNHSAFLQILFSDNVDDFERVMRTSFKLQNNGFAISFKTREKFSTHVLIEFLSDISIWFTIEFKSVSLEIRLLAKLVTQRIIPFYLGCALRHVSQNRGSMTQHTECQRGVVRPFTKWKSLIQLKSGWLKIR